MWLAYRDYVWHDLCSTQRACGACATQECEGPSERTLPLSV